MIPLCHTFSHVYFLHTSLILFINLLFNNSGLLFFRPLFLINSFNFHLEIEFHDFFIIYKYNTQVYNDLTLWCGYLIFYFVHFIILGYYVVYIGYFLFKYKNYIGTYINIFKFIIKPIIFLVKHKKQKKSVLRCNNRLPCTLYIMLIQSYILIIFCAVARQTYYLTHILYIITRNNELRRQGLCIV